MLTKRETEILTLMCQGDCAKAIANKLGTNVRTISSHRHNMGKKTGCTSSAQLGVWAVKRGLVA